VSKKIPNVALRNIESIKRMHVFIPNNANIKGYEIGEAIQDAAKPSQYLGRNLAAQIDGSANVPNAPSGIQAKHLGGGMIDVSISDQAQHPATNYFVELADNPGFSGARVVYSGPSRNALVGPVPNGDWHIRTYSQFQYSGSQANSNSNPPSTKVTVTGSVVSGSLLNSQGSGTGTGQTPGAGFGEL
jgi:hypothetical protein